MKKTLIAAFSAAFFCVSASAASDPKFDSFMRRVVGNQTTVGFGTNGTPMATSSAHLGTPSVGNMHVSGGTSPSLKGRSSMPVPGTLKTVPIDVATKIPARAAAKVILRGALAFTGVGLMVPAALDIYTFLKSEMQLDNLRNENGQIVADKTLLGSGYEFQFASTGWTNLSSACNNALQFATANGPDFSYTLNGSDLDSQGVPINCKLRYAAKSGGGSTFDTALALGNRPSSSASTRRIEQPEIEDMIAAKSGWPTSSTKALVEALKIPAVGKTLQTDPATVTGPATVPGEKTTTTETVKLVPGTTTVAAPGTTTETQQGTKTTTKTETQKLSYSGNTVTTNNTVTNTSITITNNVTNETKVEGDKTEEVKEKKEPQEIETCGLPGKPKCQIDETGTPEAKEETAEDDTKNAIKPLDDFLKNPKAALPELPVINWAFTLPSGCSPIALPAFDPWLQEIDVCRFQPMFHDIMGFVWVMGGIFGAIGIFWRNTFSQG